MSSLTDLREVVDVVIGVDTHVHTHSAPDEVPVHADVLLDKAPPGPVPEHRSPNGPGRIKLT